MTYLLKSGILYTDCGVPKARMKHELVGKGKAIFHADGTPAMKTEIRYLGVPDLAPGDVRNREYLLLDPEGTAVAAARPTYAPEEDPLLTGWPLSHIPRIDRAQVLLGGSAYTLFMVCGQRYLMNDNRGRCVLEITHRGLSGGWSIDTEDCFCAGILCGIFAFCRYLEQENEFSIV